jgi:hypothetical protein
LPRVADPDPLDFALAIDQNPHLAPDLSRDLGELAGEFLSDEGSGGQLPLVELLEPVPLAGLQTDDVAFEPMNGSL